MTAVANPPSIQHINRAAWGANGGQGGLNSMNHDEVARMLISRKSAQRANSSSSISSASSSNSTTTVIQSAPQTNGTSMPAASDPVGWNAAAARKKPRGAGPWPSGKTEPISGISSIRPQTVLATNGTSAASSASLVQQQSAVVPSQPMVQTSSQQQNGARQGVPVANEGNPVLYLLSMNGTFERKTITVPYYPDNLRIGRQTNAKTVPTPSNGFFDSKVLSRQHAEIWADRNGKVWIRDVRSSNGTFVNGARLSAENRDSEPHELQSQDHLELGIDIVSEDQKTVVHHKVAAKVEHAGFLGASNDPLAMSFGDLDPGNGAMMLPSQSLQSGPQARGRGTSQGSIGNSARFGPPASTVPTNIGPGQRHMNFWLTPVTTEQIVKRLTHEMRTARSQTHDLGRTEQFFSTLLSKGDFREPDKSNPNESAKQSQINGSSLSFKVDSKPRFSDPPAPPPQQPLPEKPDVGRPLMFELGTPSLKRSTTERPRSVPNVPHERPEPTSQIVSLVEALATAKKEIDAQNARMRDLEDMLQKEREARESAEKLAKTLELESISSNARMNGFAKGGSKGGALVEELSESYKENLKPNKDSSAEEVAAPTIADSVEASTAKLQERLEKMMLDMKEMKEHMESYRRRAETAETDRDRDQRSLAEMVEKIRLEEQTRRSSSTERARSPSKDLRIATGLEVNACSDKCSDISPPLDKGVTGNVDIISEAPVTDNPLRVAQSQPPGYQTQMLYQSTPYASMLGVVLIGMGLMAYMNSWQKVER